MAERILFVDDEENVLAAYKRSLRKLFSIDTANGAQAALDAVEAHGPYAVIVTDMRMPGMNGVELLRLVREQTPDTVRIMLTGNSDQRTAVDAVNEGDIFRFLNKPCPPEAMARAIAAGIGQHRLVVAEKELLEETLTRSLEVLGEVLALVRPEAFGRTSRTKRLLLAVAEEMGLDTLWPMEATAMLSQIGQVVLPDEVLRKLASGRPLSDAEADLHARHPAVGASLLDKIPRMHEVAEAIRYQQKGFDGSGPPHDDVAGEAIPLGARMLKVVEDYDRHTSSDVAPMDAVTRLEGEGHLYDPRILAALRHAIENSPAMGIRSVPVLQLTDGMTIVRDVRSASGILIVAKGHEATASVRGRLANFWRNGAIPETIVVSVPQRGDATRPPAARGESAGSR